jgi:hypothetical protein
MALRTESGGFKPVAWSKALAAVNSIAPAGVEVKMTPVKSKVAILRKEYNIWTAMMGQSGWEESNTGLPIADSQAMETYFEGHKEAKKYRYKTLPITVRN